MKKYFAYARVSTVKQGEGVSLEAQQDAITRFSEQHGFDVVELFEEKETAAKKGRPIFNAMIKRLHTGEAVGLIMHKIDRSARNFADWAKIGDLSDAGIEIHFVTESLDFQSRGGRLTADIQAVIAADYVRNLREETIKGLQGRLKNGLFPFKAPLGYLDNGKGKLKTPDPVKAPLIRKLFEAYATGEHSFKTLTELARDIGLTTMRGKPLYISGIENIIKNPFYVGIIQIKRTGRVYQGKHEPLISKNLFEKVTAVRTGKHRPKVTKHKFTYRQLIRCQLCGYRIIAETQRGHVYYRCHTKGCPTTSIREEVVDQAFERCLQSIEFNPQFAIRLKEALADLLIKKCDRIEKRDEQHALQRNSGRLSRLNDALIDGLIDREEYEQRKTRILLEKGQIQEQAQEAAHRTSPIQNIEKFLEQAQSLIQTHQKGDHVEKRHLLQILTSNIEASGRKLVFSMREGIEALQNAHAVLFGTDYQCAARSRHDVSGNRKDDEIKVCVTCLNCTIAIIGALRAFETGEVSKELRRLNLPKPRH